MYTIGEMAKQLNIAPSTLRFYDREGLLPFVQRSEGGIRVFSESDYRWLKMICCLKCAGMSLKDIKRYIQMAMQGDETVDERLKMFEDQRRKLQAQMEELQQTLDIVDYKCWYYQTAKEIGSEEAISQLPEEEVPEPYRAVRRILMGHG